MQELSSLGFFVKTRKTRKLTFLAGLLFKKLGYCNWSLSSLASALTFTCRHNNFKKFFMYPSQISYVSYK